MKILGFPGQASQKIGMGKDLYDKTEIGKKYYKTANEILETDIQSISFNGLEERLEKNQVYSASYIYCKCNYWTCYD